MTEHNPNPTARLEQTRSDLRMWSEQLDRKWERLEQLATSMGIERDVLIAIKYEEVETPAGEQDGYTTLLGLREVEGRWALSMGVGPDDMPYWDERAWEWMPRPTWTREMSVEAADHIETFVELLSKAAEATAERVETAAAAVTMAVHRLEAG